MTGTDVTTAAEERARHVGMRLADYLFTVERAATRFFAQVVGETDPVFTDRELAREQGFRDCPIMPTYLFSMGMQNPDPLLLIRTLGVDIRSVLHAEQSFDYHHPVCVGDEVRLVTTFSETYEKKGGALVFLVRETEVTRDEQLAAVMRNVVVVRS